MSDRLKGRRILITGAASGIGRRTAELFAEEDSAPALLDLNREGLADVARETRGLAVEADVAQEASVAQAVEQGAAAMGGVDGVVNAAGIVIQGSVLDVGVAAWQRVLDVNLTGTYIVIRCCLPWLAKAPVAPIVNIASGQGLLPNTPNTTAYAASKGGVVNLTRALAAELAPGHSRQQRLSRHGGHANDCGPPERGRPIRDETHCGPARDRTGDPLSNEPRIVIRYRRGAGG
jgi:NAD(P)-dependent dehydrogenase (short-subunit alcohol dehydrogenase family)